MNFRIIVLYLILYVFDVHSTNPEDFLVGYDKIVLNTFYQKSMEKKYSLELYFRPQYQVLSRLYLSYNDFKVSIARNEKVHDIPVEYLEDCSKVADKLLETIKIYMKKDKVNYIWLCAAIHTLTLKLSNPRSVKS